jgi:lipoyl(octanoyl) transferase
LVCQVRQLGLQEYVTTWQAMQQFTQQRGTDTVDELWIVEHTPVYTLGINGKREHLLAISDIPVVQCDRGGQVTYHGPGQLVVYSLLDLKRLQLNSRQLVTVLENAMIRVLADFGIVANARPEAPGVYVAAQKIGSIGLRIKRHCSYHGLSINNNMDLSPFHAINPCGYAGLQVTQLADVGIDLPMADLASQVATALITSLYR